MSDSATMPAAALRRTDLPKLSLGTKTAATLLAIVAAVVLPQLFHVIGAVSGQGTMLGVAFLPMHLPIIFVGLIAGPAVGAIAGAAIGNHNNHSTSSRVLGGLAGGAIGGLAGDAVGGSGTTYVDGVQLVYRSSDGQVYQSTQVGRICEYKLGSAIMASSRSGETRIQPNNPYGCGKR